MLKSHIGVFHSENIREINNVLAEYYCVYADLYFGTLVIFFYLILKIPHITVLLK